MALRQTGFYTFREHLVGSAFIANVRTACAEVAETALARPLVLTGRNEHQLALRPPGLVLLTCGGPFPSEGHYRDNVVVTAVRG